MMQQISIAGLLVSALLVVSCSSDDLTQAERSYLDDLDLAVAKVDETVEAVGNVLGQSWPVPSLLFETIGESNLKAVLEDTLREVEHLTPPSRFKTDHGLYVRYLRDAAEQGQEFNLAAAEQNLVAFQVSAAQLFATDSLASAQVSETFCNVVARPQEVDWVCKSSHAVPGGEYGAQVHEILKRFRAMFGPRVGAVGPPLLEDEEYQVLAAIQPEVEDILGKTRVSLAELEPPGSFRDDHERLLQYFDETLAVARSITAAGQQRDMEKLRSLYADSGTVMNAASEEFSQEFRVIVGVYF